MNEKKIHV